MAEISIEELRRLARNFLVGKGGEAELEDTKRAMDGDPQLAMEFLQQMQTALDDAAPAGFSPDQWKEIDARVAALMAPLAKGGLGFLGKLFSKLFKKKPAAQGPSRIRRSGAPEEAKPKAALSESPTSLLSPQPMVPQAGAEPAEGMEEMAPIAPAAATPPPLPGLESAKASASIQTSPEPAPAAPAVAAGAAGPAAPKPGSKKALLALLTLVLLALAFGAWRDRWLWPAKPQPVPPPQPVATPAPKPTPKAGPPMRSLPPPEQREPLPSELPPMTPQAAGHVAKIPGLEAKDKDGSQSLPLP